MSAGNSGNVRRLLRFAASSAGSAVVVGTLSAVTFSLVVLSKPPASSFDAWAYSAWGQALARGERPVYALSATLPKPLATLLGAGVAPFPAPRGIAIAVACGLGVIVGALFFIASREAGTVASVVAVAAFLAGASIERSLFRSHIDIVIAALLAIGLCAHGVARVTWWGLAGLLRPEAWAITALGGFTAGTGSMRRKIALAIGAGLVPVVLWIGFDLVSAGDPLATLHWRENRRAAIFGAALPDRTVPWLDVPAVLYRPFKAPLVVFIALVGLIGLTVGIVRSRGTERLEKALPLLVALTWVALVAVELHEGQARFQRRYLLPVVPMLALGCAFLAGALVKARIRPPLFLSAGATVVLVGLFGATFQIDGGGHRWVDINQRVQRTVPSIERFLECGRVGVRGDRTAPALVAMMAAASRTPASRFQLIPRAQTFERLSASQGLAAVLLYGEDGRLSEWPRIRTPLGELAIAPRCRHLIQGMPGSA